MENILTTNESNNQTNKYFQILNKHKEIEIHYHKSKKITFNNELDSNNCSTILNINLIETYNNTSNTGYYQAEYEFINYVNGIENNSTVPKSHPFYDVAKDYFDSYSEGILVVKNKLTSQLIKYLFMDNDTLKKDSGLSTAQWYRVGIMKSLARLGE
jgi:hypothetical protein